MEAKPPVTGDARTLNGLEAKTFIYEADDGSADETVLSMGSLTLKASCEAGANNGLTVRARSDVSGATISFTSISQGGTGSTGNGQARNNSYGTMLAGNDQVILSPGGTTQTTNGSHNIGWSSGTIVYSVPSTGEVTSIDWAWIANRGGNNCTWTGTALGGDDGHAVLHRAPGQGSSLSELQRARRAG